MRPNEQQQRPRNEKNARKRSKTKQNPTNMGTIQNRKPKVAPNEKKNQELEKSQTRKQNKEENEEIKPQKIWEIN